MADTPEKEEAVIDLLAEYIGADKETVKKKLERKGSYYEVVKEKVEDDQADALMAAAVSYTHLPEDTEYYFFLADREGKFYYATTAEEHAANIEAAGIEGVHGIAMPNEGE